MLAQPNPAGTGTLADVYRSQGITDPFSDPRVIQQATDQNTRANDRNTLIASSGNTASGYDLAPWSDPNYAKYEGTNREAYNLGMQAKGSPAAYNALKAQYGWDDETAQSWILRSTDPAAWNKQAAAASAAAGLVAGPGPSSNSPQPRIGTPEPITRDRALGVIPDLTNPFTDTGAPTTSPLDTYAMQTYGRPLTDSEKEVLSNMPLTDARNVMDTSIANYNASQNAAPLGSDESYNYSDYAGNSSGGGKRGGKVSKDGITALLRRR